MTFALYRTIGEQSLTETCKVLTFTMDAGGTVNVDFTKENAFIDAIDGEISIQFSEAWKALLQNLPEYDEEGRRYEYLILEENGNPTYETSIDSSTGDYTTIVTNGPGGSHRILVQKNWVDDSDAAHREPVEVTVYSKEGDQAITFVTLGESQEDGDPIWYAWAGIGELTPDQVYIRETKIGATAVLGTEGAPTEGEINAPGITRDTVPGRNHAYEATYDREEIAGETVCTVTNRRLGNVDLTVTKDWRDGGGDGVGELQAALENTSGLTLAVKLKIAASDDTEGQFKIYQKDGFGYVNLGGGDVQIQDRSERRVSSIQPILTADTKSNSLDFWNLPKYDTNGTVVRYTVEEVWLDGGNEITLDQLRTISPEVYALWNTYTSSVKEESYTANDGENKNDEQKITLTNKRTGVTDAVWYKQWYDIYMYGSGSRPDIYLDIYRTVHTSAAEDGIETELIYPSYRWTNEGLLPPETEAPSEGAGDPAGEEPGTASGDNGSADRQYFWRAELENLPKYDDWGYKITYSAVERTSVNASDFDYAIAEYWTGETCLGTRDEADPGMEAAYEAQTTNLDGVNPPVSQDASSSYAKYALNANGTFVNRLNKPVAIEGRKLWTNLPAGYPAVDLPNVAFALYRRVQGSGEAFDFGGAPIATLTVQDWSGLKNYTFRLLYEGKNIIDDGAGTVRPESEDQPGLPKYTEEGKLYEYVLREEGITGANGLPLDGTGEGPQESLDLFDIQEISNTFQVENVFHSPTGSLSVKKILELPLGGDDLPIAYPAVRFHLYRVYIQNNGQPSAQELVRTATWSSEEVEAAYQQRGDSTTVETVLSFTGLEQYAPNGSLYLYHVEEDKSFLGGYDTWCGPGDLEAQDVTGDGYTVGGLLPHEEREEADATFLNSRKAVQTEFVTLTGQKAWEDFYDAFGLRPDAPYEEGKDGTLVPVIRLTVTRRAAAQEGQGDPHIEEKLTEGEDYTVKWTQDAETGKWTYQIWGADDPDAEEPGISAEEPAEPGPGQGEETTPPTEMPPEEGNQPADPPTDEGDTQSPEPPADGEEDQNPDSQAGDGDGQSAPQEETLSAASLHSDPADGEHGGAGSVPVTPTEPAEDPDQIGDPDSQDPSEETPPAAQPQTELEKWAPNGARWVYTVKEELNSDLKEALYERYQYYFTGNGTAGEDSADGDTIHMKELKNSLETRAPFTKRWVGSDGEPITADYMDLGEMSVTFELYVKEGKSGGWQRAADYFTQENLGEDAYEKLKDAGILNGFSITLENRHIYDSWSGACENLPRVVKKDSGISELSYRVVETEIAYQGGAATITVDTSGEEFAYTVADSGGLFTGIEDTYTESGNSTTIINKLATTSLQVQKIWTNDRNNVYGTRPDTDEAGKTWETSFLIQRTTDLSVGWEAAAWEAVQVTGENGQKQDLVVTLTGTDTEGTVESPVGMTISGLPKQNAEREYTYRAVELEPGYQMTNGAVDLSSYVLLRDSYNEAYTAAYTYGGQSDDGFLTTAANDMQTTKVFAGKTWMPAGEEGAQVTLHLQYAVPLENPAEGPAYTWKTLTAVSVTLDGTADPDLDKPYYEYAEWKAVWENLPARMPGSYLPDSDSETEYRVTEAVSGSYVQVGDTKKENKTDVDGTYPEFQFTNKAVTSLTVEKKWHTADAKKHPITMELWRTTDKNLIGKTGVDGVEQVAGMTAELSAANNWRHIFGELDKVNSQNQKYYYYAIEQGTPDEDMEVIYDHGEPTETTVAFTTAITNRGYTDIPVSKTWRDDSDAQGLRPETLKLTLYRRTDPAAQGEVAGEVTLSAKNAQDGNADVWTYTFEHLPDTDGSGNPYTYWVEEEHLESYTVTGSGTLALTNTLGGKETEIAIQGRKTWVGDGADDRPNSITLSLLQNGTKVAEREVTPNADGSWTYDFGSWPAYDDSGRAYTYTVQEEPVDGYGSRVDGWNVINGKGNLTVKKQVYSGDRQRDFSFTVTLDDKSINGICGDMTFQDGVAAFTLKDGESKTAKGLPSGVGYTVAEARVDGYGTRVEGHNPGMVPFGDTAEVLIINYDDTTPPPDPDPDPDPKPDPDPGPDPMPDPDPHPTPDPDESPDPDMPDTPDEPGHPDEPDDSVPTGDTAQLALYLALLAASLAGAAAIVILGRKGRKRD
ncbi:MAG: Cna B-type domain-containing protein [Dysosmobacter welbionis]|uniref:Cna B-type domain-containing protein n=1 Tax=Dysosmobacter welbionis TaxID=2093857 RepID=UPI00399C03BF